MKRALAIAVLVSAMLSLALAEVRPQRANGNSKAEQELMKVEYDWAKAVVDRNTAIIDRIQADDFIGYDFEGKLYTKAENITGLKSGVWKMESLDLADVKVRAFGDTAVVTSRAIRKGRYKDLDSTGQFRWTRVYVKRQGRWQMVAQQSTRITQPPTITNAASPPASGQIIEEEQKRVEYISSEGRLSKPEQEVRRANDERLEALLRSDWATLDPYYADDFLTTRNSGEVKNKSQVIEDLKSGERKIVSIHDDDIRVRVYGSMAVMTGRTRSRIIYRGQESGGLGRYMHVFVKRQGRWQLVAHHVTPIAQ